MNLTEQGYYNLIVYESDPVNIPHLFESTEEDELYNHLDDLETALDFINDRMADSRDEHFHVAETDVNLQELYMKALRLEGLRKRALGDDYEPHIDLNDVLH